MKFKIKHITKKEIELDIEFPLYRAKLLKDGINVYYKFSSYYKVIIIKEYQNNNICITTYNDQNVDILSDIMDENLLIGKGDSMVINENRFNSIILNLAEKIFDY